jgi:hypothetical protein
MRDETVIKITAIISLVALEIVNMMTMKIDSQVLLIIGAIIGGIAGYEIGKKGYKPKTNKT